jgi:hypothetical protein
MFDPKSKSDPKRSPFSQPPTPAFATAGNGFNMPWYPVCALDFFIIQYVMVGGGRGNVCCCCKPAEFSAADQGSSRQNLTKLCLPCFVLETGSAVEYYTLILMFTQTICVKMSYLEMCDIDQRVLYFFSRSRIFLSKNPLSLAWGWQTLEMWPRSITRVPAIRDSNLCHSWIT